LKAVAIDGNEESPVLTHSYFIGEGVHERFETDYVFSLSTNNDNLYGDERGILVKGKEYEDFVAEYPDETPTNNILPNYMRRGREWEHPVHVEVVTALGELVLNQNVGMRVYGGVTRGYPQKSLRLIGRKEYGSKSGKFDYPFFVDCFTADKYPKPILSYDTLVLRNDGNDWWGGRLRTPLASWIAAEAGFIVVSPYAATAVFINGEYYGYAVLNARIDEHFLQKIYSVPDRAFEFAEDGHIEIETENTDSRNEWLQMVELVERGLTDSTIEALERFIDIDNFLIYHAFQT
jgi:hypothetical protein